MATENINEKSQTQAQIQNQEIDTTKILNTLFFYCGALFILPLAVYYVTVTYATPKSTSATVIAGIAAALTANAVLLRYCYVAARDDAKEEKKLKRE